MLTKSKETITWMKQNGYLNKWLLPLNVTQDRNPYNGSPVDNSPEFMPLDNLLNYDILNSLHICRFLSCYILYGEATRKEKRTMGFSYSTLREIAQGLKSIWYSKMEEHLLQPGLLNTLTERWKRRKWSSAKMVMQLRG